MGCIIYVCIVVIIMCDITQASTIPTIHHKKKEDKASGVSSQTLIAGLRFFNNGPGLEKKEIAHRVEYSGISNTSGTKETAAKCQDSHHCSLVNYVLDANGFIASSQRPKHDMCWYFPYMGVIGYQSNFYFQHFCLGRDSSLTVHSPSYFDYNVTYRGCKNTGYYFWVPRVSDLYFRFRSRNNDDRFNVTFETPTPSGMKSTNSSDFKRFAPPSDEMIKSSANSTSSCVDHHNCSVVHYLFDANGSFVTPQYPKHYPRNANICWYFPNNKMRNNGYNFSIVDFCLDDRATLTVNSNTYGGVFASYSGCKRGGGEISVPLYPDLYFNFKSNGADQLRGFNISFVAT